MKGKFYIPIRLKILSFLLLTVTTVISLITFTMANLYHQEMKVYTNELASILVLSVAQECRSILDGYANRLTMYGNIMRDDKLGLYTRVDLVEGILGEFEGLVAIAFYEGKNELASFRDQQTIDDGDFDWEHFRTRVLEDSSTVERLEVLEVLVKNAPISRELQTFALVFALPGGNDEPLTIWGLIRLDELQHLIDRGTVFEISIFDESGTLIAHPNRELVAQGATIEFPSVVHRLQDSRISAIALDMDDPDGLDVSASFAGVGVGGLGVKARMLQAVTHFAPRDLVKTLVGVALTLLVLSAVAGVIESRRITRPVEGLSAAARDIGKGRFDVQVEVGSNDEMGTLARSFNEMARELQNRETALREAQAQLVESEKMAAFGQLGAGIAHEVKNPLTGILGCAQIALRKVEGGTHLERDLQLIEREALRCKTIVENLLKFARKDKIRLEAVDMNQVVKDTIAIVRHQLVVHDVKVESLLVEDVPYIIGNANQLQQVLMNLMINAQQAMEGQAGSVAVSTRLTQGDRVEVKVSDTGPGIPEDKQQRIFEPFFTTKPGGKGTGLGLSVSYGIIKEHKGDIHVESQPGEGCTFVITIPIVKEGGISEPDTRVA